jgi:murein DD-endopeptidase MepM/ murein hydrolase activator NlpD
LIVLLALCTTLVVSAPPANARLRAMLAARFNERVQPVATVEHPIVRGETFGAILSRYGVSASEIHQWYEAARSKFDLHRLSPGQSLTLSFNEDQRLVALHYHLDGAKRLAVLWRGNRRYDARIEDLHVNVSIVGVRGTIQSSFYRGARIAGLPDSVISSMVDLLSSEVDFSSDVRPGDRFRVLYEQRRTVEGRTLEPGRILAADFVGRRISAAAFLYEDEDGHTTYVDSKGQPLDGALLRYPLDFTRISSTFSYSRFHPILHRRRPHMGVDFAAPRGTPVRAVGNGAVRWAAWKGGLGRHIEIDHGSGIISTYSHLQRIQSSLHNGVKVRRGEVIGWVGSSGLATGPHLHFAIFDNGRYVNPLKFHKAPAVTRINADQFERLRAKLVARMQVAAGTPRPTTSTPPVLLSSFGQARRLGPTVLTL